MSRWTRRVYNCSHDVQVTSAPIPLSLVLPQLGSLSTIESPHPSSLSPPSFPNHPPDLRRTVNVKESYMFEEINKARSTCHLSNFATTADWCDLGQVTIDVLPDEVVLEIFNLYRLQTSRFPSEGIRAWHTLVHVCRHWRNVVFGSPLRLNLQLLCTAKTPVRETLDVWPALPIRVQDPGPITDEDNITAVLEHSDRIYEIILHEVPDELLEKILAAFMQKPFPLLTDVQLVLNGDGDMALFVPPNLFSAGSAPCLQEIRLDGISFPELPKLFLCATHLVHLNLLGLPHPEHMSPEMTATYLSALTSLEHLLLDFQLSQSHPVWGNPRPQTRSLFPSLTTFCFRGVFDYLEDFVARIDAPRLDYLSITFKQIVFDTSQLVHFIRRTPSFRGPDAAHVGFQDSSGFVSFSSRTPGFGLLNVEVLCERPFPQLWSLARVCSSFSPPLSTVESLFIHKHQYLQSDWPDASDIENAHWLELLRSFTMVNTLYLCELFAPRIRAALGGLVEEGITEVLPVLHNIVEGEFCPLVSV